MIQKIIYILPVVVMIESFIASIILFIGGKYGTGMYWLFAGAISYSATFLITRWG